MVVQANPPQMPQRKNSAKNNRAIDLATTTADSST